MKLRNLILFAAACALTPLAIHARTWTAVDGRTIEADFISASPTSVTIVRQPDGHKFTVPLERLCEADRTYVAKLLAWETARIKALTALQEAMPPPADPSNDSRQLWEKYRSAVRFIRPGTIAPHVKQLRQMIERDLAQLDIDGGARIGPPSQRVTIRQRGRGTDIIETSTDRSSAQTSILTARKNAEWLRTTFAPYLSKIETLTTPPADDPEPAGGGQQKAET